MPDSSSPFRDDHLLAHELATAAGRVLLDLRSQAADSARRHGGDLGAGDAGDVKRLRDAGDRTAHEFLVRALAERRPGDAVLSEESFGTDGSDPPRLRADRVWIVDPLDGTREFAELDRDDWAVHVALWSRAARDGSPSGDDLAAGAVALPAQGVTLSTGEPGGAATADAAPRPVARVAVSRTRPPAFTDELVRRLGAEPVPMGSAGAKIAAVVQGRVDAYVHAGGQYEWDTAAPVAVARAAGFHASRIDGSALAYNRADPTSPDIVVCRSSLASALLDAIRAAAGGMGT